MGIKVNQELKNYIENIKAADKNMLKEAETYLNSLAKPPGSLGKLEEIAAKICSVTGKKQPSIAKRCIIVMSADNGVVSEGISSAPQEVTKKQTINMLKGISGVGVLAKQFHVNLMVADIGIATDISFPGLLDYKIRKSTGNIAKETAMTKSEAEEAVLVGIELVERAREEGCEAIGTGEMGIGNTTTSSAVLMALLEMEETEDAVGRGGGLSEEAFRKKKEVVQKALTLHRPNASDPIEVLSKVGGLDLAGMTGVYLGAAYYKIPVVIDGFISAVAALCAVRLNPFVKEYLFASHQSFEKGYLLAMEEIGIKPCLNLDMRLGEGSGCPLMFSVMDASLAVLNQMATFEEAGIEDDYLEPIRKLEEEAFR